MKRKKIIACLAGMMLMLTPTVTYADSTDVQLIVNNGYVGGGASEGQAYISNVGRTMLPLRMINSALNYQTEWHEDGTIHISDASKNIDMIIKIGSTTYSNQGVSGQFEVAPILKNNRTYLAARDFAKLTGDIYWEHNTRTVWLTQGKALQYQVIGDKLLRANCDGIYQIELPTDYRVEGNVTFEPIKFERVIDGVSYLAIQCVRDYTKPVPLFRDDGAMLIYLTDVYPATVYVDGNAVYYTDGMNVGGWSNPVEPNRLYAVDLRTGKTTTHLLDFEVNQCILDKKDGQLIAKHQVSGIVHKIRLAK